MPLYNPAGTTDPLTLASGLTLSDTAFTSTKGVTFGTDSHLWRSAATTVKTDAQFKGADRIDANSGGSNSQVSCGSGTRARVVFGVGEDIGFERIASGVLNINGGTAATAPTVTGPALVISNCGTAPSTNPVGGPILYAEAGALKCRGTGGTIVTLCAA